MPQENSKWQSVDSNPESLVPELESFMITLNHFSGSILLRKKKKNPLPSGKNNITGDYSMPGIGGLGLSRLWSRALPLEISKLTLQNSGTLGNKE